ncbi:MAG: hypothetical protein ACO1SX_09665, partial [Actinomycetota bacterium]
MKLRWKPRTSLFARMSLLFGLLVTVPLVISGMVLSLAGWRSVYESGSEVAIIGTQAVEQSADVFQKEAEKKMTEAGSKVADLGKERLQATSDQALEIGKQAFNRNAGLITERGQEAVSGATRNVVEVGENRLKSSLGDLAAANSKSLQLLERSFSEGMEKKLQNSDAPIRENLESSSRRSWELSAERRLLAVKDRMGLLQSNIQLSLQYPLNTREIIYPDKDDLEPTRRALQLVLKNRPEVVRAVLAADTGSEWARVPDTDPAVGEDVDWFKAGSRERKTFDAIQAAPSAVSLEPLWYDERTKLWLRRITTKVPVPVEARPEAMMPAPAADGVPVKRDPVPFIVVDFRLDKVVDEVTRELPEGLNLLVIHAGSGKVLSDTSMKENPALVKSILEKLPSGEEAAPFEKKPRDFELIQEDGSKLLARALLWETPDNCWTVVTQPESVILKPLIAMQNGIRNAWRGSLDKVNSESKQLIKDRTKVTLNLREQLVAKTKAELAKRKEQEQIKVANDLKRYQKQMAEGLQKELQPKLAELRARAGEGMERAAAERAADAFKQVKLASDQWTKDSGDSIQHNAQLVANRTAGRMLSYSIWLIPLFLVLALFLATLTARSLVRPINQLVKGTQALA